MANADDGPFLSPVTRWVGEVGISSGGVSLRDLFAGQVLAALTVNGTDAAWEDDAVAAYAAADAMIAARGPAPKAPSAEAAAPDVLEALNDLLTRPTDPAARERARAVIAKAQV